MAELDELRAEVAALRAEVAALRGGPCTRLDLPVVESGARSQIDRRKLFAMAAGGVLGAGFLADPAAANDPNDVVLGGTNTSGTTTAIDGTGTSAQTVSLTAASASARALTGSAPAAVVAFESTTDTPQPTLLVQRGGGPYALGSTAALQVNDKHGEGLTIRMEGTRVNGGNALVIDGINANVRGFYISTDNECFIDH